jgi:hypothetical protein
LEARLGQAHQGIRERLTFLVLNPAFEEGGLRIKPQRKKTAELRSY